MAGRVVEEGEQEALLSGVLVRGRGDREQGEGEVPGLPGVVSARG